MDVGAHRHDLAVDILERELAGAQAAVGTIVDAAVGNLQNAMLACHDARAAKDGDAQSRGRVMTSEHCILQVANGCIHDCASCRLRARKLSLKNIDGKVMPVRTDIHGRSRLYDAYPIDLTPQVPQLLDAGVRRLMVDGTLLETDEVGRAVARVRRAVEAAQAGRKPAARLRGATSGCMFVGIS